MTEAQKVIPWTEVVQRIKDLEQQEEPHKVQAAPLFLGAAIASELRYQFGIKPLPGQPDFTPYVHEEQGEWVIGVQTLNKEVGFDTTVRISAHPNEEGKIIATHPEIQGETNGYFKKYGIPDAVNDAMRNPQATVTSYIRREFHQQGQDVTSVGISLGESVVNMAIKMTPIANNGRIINY